MNESDQTGDRRAQPKGAFAAGAARATGERRRRAGTPLISSTDPVEVSAARRSAASSSADAASGARPTPATAPHATAPHAAGPPEAAPRKRRPPRSRVQQQAAKGAAAGQGDRTDRADRADRARLRAVPPPSEDSPTPEPPAAQPGPGVGAVLTGAASQVSGAAEKLMARFLESADTSSAIRPGPAELVELAVNVIRAAATSAGVPTEEVERQVAETLAYIRRRLTGEVVVDEFGFDEDYTRHIHLPLLRPLYKRWFRVEVRGIENIPATGGALVVANHSGTIAIDAMMTQVAVHDEHPEHRHLRMLGADLVFQTPFVGTIARRSGSTLAANTDAERLLTKGELVGVWPEGFKGVGKPFSERYKLQRFGRGGFVAAALRAGVPIVPCSIVGAEEIYPMLGNMPAVARLLGLPYAPVTPTFPWLGLLGLVPLPSKWLIEFGPPVDTASLGPDAADDPMVVFDLTDQVRETIQQTLYSLLMQRTSVFI